MTLMFHAWLLFSVLQKALTHLHIAVKVSHKGPLAFLYHESLMHLLREMAN